MKVNKIALFAAIVLGLMSAASMGGSQISHAAGCNPSVTRC